MARPFTPPESVGYGVDRQDSPSGLSLPQQRAPQKEDDADDFRFGTVWGDKPYIKDQQNRYPDSVKIERVETRVYDLSIPEQAEALNIIQTLSVDLNGNTLVSGRESHWSETTSNWKIMLELQILKFRELVKIKK